MRDAGAADYTFGPGVAERIRLEIERARGNEVCVLLSVGEGGRLEHPRVVGRGNAGAVLATVRAPEGGGMLLHNHPSGVLEPSGADLGVAAALWEQGLGFAITDNAVSALYVVVEPPRAEAAVPLDAEAVAAELAAGSALARHHGAYEDRPQQRDLTRLIVESYNRGGVAIAEAGTGTGKSIAYLLPAIRWALLNKERTVVSTNTINLQEQLVEKDLPLLERVLGEPFRYAMVKGRNNYVSIRRARLAALSAPSLLPDEKQAELTALVEWLETTRDGSLSDLPFRPAPEVWDEVASDSDVCLRARCPSFESCFYQRARREAASADVLVVNHHLLFSDLAVRRANSNYSAPAVLPHFRRLILDEAHNIEDAATSHMGSRISRRGLFRVLRRLENRGRGVLPAFRKALVGASGDLIRQGTADLLDTRLSPGLERAREGAARVFDHLAGVMLRGSDATLRLERRFDRDPVWAEGLEEDLAALLRTLEELLDGFRVLRDRVSVDEEIRQRLEPQLLELRGAANRLDAAGAALRSGLRPGETELRMVRWMELRRDPRGNEPDVIVSAVPLDLAALLREELVEKVPTVVLTSATLATRNDFRFLRERIGLRDEDPVREAILPSPFDYASQAMLLVPSDLPLPANDQDRRFHEGTVAAVRAHAEASDGGLFVLFTSYRALQQVARTLRQAGVDGRWPLLVHGEAPRAQLVQRFVESGRAILLGTASFWEGVDVPGRPLRGLVIPRLPFKVPSEPITAARVEAIEASGGNAFTGYMLPHAAIRLKQGFGRLIRSRVDRGVVLLLDGRLVQKSYGRYILESLPPAELRIEPWDDARESLRSFYLAEPLPELNI